MHAKRPERQQRLTDDLVKEVGTENLGTLWLLAYERFGPQCTLAQIKSLVYEAKRPDKRPGIEINLHQPESLYQREDGGYEMAPINYENRNS